MDVEVKKVNEQKVMPEKNYNQNNRQNRDNREFRPNNNRDGQNNNGFRRNNNNRFNNVYLIFIFTTQIRKINYLPLPFFSCSSSIFIPNIRINISLCLRSFIIYNFSLYSLIISSSFFSVKLA